VQEKVTKEKHTLGIALFGLLPEKSASATCVPLTARPCADSGIGAIHRAAPSGIAAAAAAMQREPGAARILRAKPEQRSPGMDGIRKHLLASFAAVGAYAFLVTFCASTAPQERREQRSWPRRDEGQDARRQK